MKVKEMFPDRWLKAEHLQGKTHLLTIERVTVEGLFNPETKKYERKFVMRFCKKNLPMVVNKTQALALAQITGEDDTDLWPGHQIALSPATTANGKDTMLVSRPPEVAKAEAALPSAA